MTALVFDIFARDKTAQAFASAKANAEGFNKSFDKLGKTIGVFKTAIASAFALEYFKGAAEAAEHIQDLSDRLGIGAEVLSEYQLVANNTGVELDDIATAMQKLAKNSVDAVEKGGEAAESLKYLGINAQAFAQLPIDDKFSVLATAIEKVNDPSKRVQLAMSLMGKSGAEMLQVMQGGGAALQEMQQRADALGITLTQTQVGAVDGMMDSLGELGLTAKGAAQQFIAFFAPAVEAVAKVLSFVLAAAVNTVGNGFKALVGAVLDAIGRIANGFAWLTRQFSILPGAAGDAFKNISDSLGNYGDILTSVSSQNDAFTDGQKKFSGEVDKSAAALDRLKGKLFQPDASKGLKGSMDDAGKAAKSAADGAADDWSKAADSMQNDIGKALDGISINFNDLRGTAISALEAVGNAIVKNLLNQAFGSSGGGGFGGGLGGSMGGGSGLGGIVSQLGSWFGGFFADGGNFMGGKPIVVGERGPEIIMPKNGGSVIPNDKIGGSSRTVSVQMNISTPDAMSFKRSQSQIAAGMAAAIQQGSRNL